MSADAIDNLVPEEDSTFDPKIIAEVENTETPPVYASDEWHDWVFRQFRDDELENGNPVRDGLIRVVEKVIGPVVSSTIINYSAIGSPAMGNDFNSVVHVRLSVQVTNPNHPLVGSILTQDGIAESNTRNTKGPYHLHPSATSVSKAEGQAARKLLRLRKSVSAEEVTPDDMVAMSEVFVPDEPISSEQVNIIDLLCRRANIDVWAFINCGKKKYNLIEQITVSNAQSMIQFLGEIQSGKKASPVHVEYDAKWRQRVEVEK